MTASAAYVSAGYTFNRGNASRLKANESIQARMRELLQQRTDRLVDISFFNALAVLTRLSKLSDNACEAGNHRAALQAMIIIAKCLGYTDNPTYLREQLGVTPPSYVEPLKAPRANDAMAKIIAKFRSRSP